jgi:hypothetical protein
MCQPRISLTSQGNEIRAPEGMCQTRHSLKATEGILATG